MKYFADIRSLKDLKEQYRILAIKLHPDKGGDAEQFKAMSAEFSLLFAVWKNRKDESGEVRDENKTEDTCEGWTSRFYHQQGWTGENYGKHGHDTAAIVADVRAYASLRFPQFTFSVTRDNRCWSCHLINVALMQSPYKIFKGDEDGKIYAGLDMTYHQEDSDEMTPEVREAIFSVWQYLQTFNYEYSDAMVDYFDRGFYGNLTIGKYNKPCKIEANRKFRTGGAAPAEFKWRTGKAHAAINKAMGANIFGSVKHLKGLENDERLFYGPKSAITGQLTSINDYGPVGAKRLRQKLENAGILVGHTEESYRRWSTAVYVKHYSFFFLGYTPETEAALAAEDKEREEARKRFAAEHGTQRKSEAREETRGCAGGVTIEDYSDKAFAVFGDTKPRAEELKGLGGKFCRNLHGRAGWIFSKKREQAVREALCIQNE